MINYIFTSSRNGNCDNIIGKKRKWFIYLFETNAIAFQSTKLIFLICFY